MWQRAMEDLDVASYDELVLTNSSIFGPMFSMGPMFAQMEAAPCDFWGATDNHEIEWHLQSYFLTFKRRVLQSDAFARFFGSVLPYRDKWQIIRSYEVGMTAFLQQSGFFGQAYVPADTLFPPWPLALAYKGRRKNPTCYHPLRLLRRGMPFVKVELLRDNPGRLNLAPLRQAIASTGYDPSLIEIDGRETRGWGQRLSR
jgi:lipopolysaccharide biosynthesis protein